MEIMPRNLLKKYFTIPLAGQSSFTLGGKRFIYIASGKMAFFVILNVVKDLNLMKTLDSARRAE
jgi:hypothetical protein